MCRGAGEGRTGLANILTPPSSVRTKLSGCDSLLLQQLAIASIVQQNPPMSRIRKLQELWKPLEL
jgi:hypothetical protein